MGLITFATSDFTATADVVTIETVSVGEVPTVDLTQSPSAQLEVSLDQLRSGNSLYDAELQRRLNVRRYPSAIVELEGMLAAPGSTRHAVTGSLTLRGVTRQLSGTVEVAFSGSDLVVTGSEIVDMRDFQITAPGMLMLRIYPDVRVSLHLELAPDAGGA